MSSHQNAASNRSARFAASRIERVADCLLAEATRAASGQALRRIDVALHLAERDRPLRYRAIGVKDRVVEVLPALVDQARFVGAVIFDEAVAIGIARPVDPAQRRFDVRP